MNGQKDQVVPFDFNGSAVRIVEIEKQPWFVAKDICDVLDIGRTQDSVRYLDDDEKGRCLVDTPFGRQEALIVNEPGLYSLILRSRKPEAKAFKRWITHEVLPAIRTTGMYHLQVPKTFPEALRALADETEKTAKLQKRIELDRPKVELANAIAASNTAIPIKDFAQVISKAGAYIIGEKNFFKWLKHEKILDAARRPYQRYIDAGWFEVVQRENKSGNGPELYRRTLITGPGQVAVYKQFCNSKSRNIFLNKAAKSNNRFFFLGEGRA